MRFQLADRQLAPALFVIHHGHSPPTHGVTVGARAGTLLGEDMGMTEEQVTMTLNS